MRGSQIALLMSKSLHRVTACKNPKPVPRARRVRRIQAMAAAFKIKSPSFSLERLLRFSSLLVLFFVSLLNTISADEIFTSTSGATLGWSSREPKYKIEFHPAKFPLHPDVGQESMVMSNKHGQNYVCFLPTVEQTKTIKSFTKQNSSSIILETDRRIKLKKPDELLDVLKDKCFYRHEGWWTYEFCHLKHLRQLHLEDDKWELYVVYGVHPHQRHAPPFLAIQEFYLGQFDPEATAEFNQNHSDTSMFKDPRAKDASQRYHAHQFTNGTVCDLTNQPRETEVRFVCSEPTVIITSIKEISTCKYVATVQCPVLCKHPMFQQERPMWHTIHCNKMPGDSKDSSSIEDGTRATQITVVTDDSGRYAT